MDNPLVQVEPGLFIWTILVFVVLLTLLKKFACGPLLVALEERQERRRLGGRLRQQHCGGRHRAGER